MYARECFRVDHAIPIGLVQNESEIPAFTQSFSKKVTYCVQELVMKLMYYN